MSKVISWLVQSSVGIETLALSEKDDKSWYAGSGHFIIWLDDNSWYAGSGHFIIWSGDKSWCAGSEHFIIWSGDKSWYAGLVHFITWLDDNTRLDPILAVSVLLISTGRLSAACMYVCI